MKHTFISHSTKNKDTADNIVKNLEDNGVPCWIAPRNINAGTNYGAALSSAIRDCGTFVLVFSEYSNISDAVFREVQLAFESRKTIIPVRINDVPVSDDLKFFLSGIQWVNATPEQLQFNKLIDDIHRLMNVPHAVDSGNTTELLDYTEDVSQNITLRNFDNLSQSWTVALDMHDEITIGRHPNNRIHIAEPSISREQCKIYMADGVLTIENSSNSNITQLNNAPLNIPAILQPNDRIKCGRIILIVE
ncbi:MAG: TIR domain-containing protein [Defluviitaleaceae bacterium]|nr:TIR domain-containing protein [Defluviitaleaceae bacterium]